MSAHRTPIHRVNLQGRKIPLQSPPPGLSNKRTEKRLRAIYPYSLDPNRAQCARDQIIQNDCELR